MSQLDVEIRIRSVTAHRLQAPCPLEIGRRQQAEPPPYQLLRNEGGGSRLIVADASSRRVPRHYAVFDRTAEGQLSVTNTHPHFALHLAGGETLDPGHSISAEGELQIRLEPGIVLCVRQAESAAKEQAEPRVQAPVAAQDTTPLISLCTALAAESPDERAAATITLLRSAIFAFQHAAGSPSFYQSAARAAAGLIELDEARVLLRCEDESGWREAAHYPAAGSDAAPAAAAHRTLLGNVLREQATQSLGPPSDARNGTPSPATYTIAAPIFDARRRVIGALYGERHGGKTARAFAPGETMLLETLCDAIAASLLRQQAEQRRVQLSQFFGPHVLDRLECDPRLLEGQDAEITVLFGDIRGFSRASERLGPGNTIRWVNDVMTALSQCVLDEEGVLVDYSGDQLLAMWGAPCPQADHAAHACRCAMAMLRTVPELRRRWSDRLQVEFDLGIGISTGIASVGNTGSEQKFKYGPLGSTVNLGSRLQAATKPLGVHAVASEATVRAAGNAACLARRLCQLQPSGIATPVTAYQLVADPPEHWDQLGPRYDQALQHFEAGNLAEAATALEALLREYPEDGPARSLLARTQSLLVHPQTHHDPVWRLDEK